MDYWLGAASSCTQYVYNGIQKCIDKMHEGGALYGNAKVLMP